MSNLSRRVACGVVLLTGLGGVSSTAFAQINTERVVQGIVVDKSSKPLNGATVYLKDEHTLSVKSYISTDGGQYRFGQLNPNTDYELWAESSGKKSSTKSISSYDTRKQFNITLKIDR